MDTHFLFVEKTPKNNENFNVEFHQQKKDQCDICLEYQKLLIKHNSNKNRTTTKKLKMRRETGTLKSKNFYRMITGFWPQFLIFKMSYLFFSWNIMISLQVKIICLWFDKNKPGNSRGLLLCLGSNNNKTCFQWDQ